MERADPLSEHGSYQLQREAQSGRLSGFQEFCRQVPHLFAVAVPPSLLVERHQ
jgi:hypothetical protein